MPAKVHAKLLVAFFAITVLLIALGAVGLQALNDTNRRAKDLVELQRKIAAYRQLQHDTTAQLYSVASALLVHDDRTLDATLRQLNQFGYDLDRLQFVAKDEVELLGQVRKDYDQFIQVVTQSVELIRAGKIEEGNQLQIAQANPLAERLERLMNQLVNRAEADMVASIEASETAYAHSRRIVIGLPWEALRWLFSSATRSPGRLSAQSTNGRTVRRNRLGQFFPARRRTESRRARNPGGKSESDERRARPLVSTDRDSQRRTQ